MTVGSWTMSPSDVYVPARVLSTQQSDLVVFNSTGTNAAVLAYANGAFSVTPATTPVSTFSNPTTYAFA